MKSLDRLIMTNMAADHVSNGHKSLKNGKMAGSHGTINNQLTQQTSTSHS